LLDAFWKALNKALLLYVALFLHRASSRHRSSPQGVHRVLLRVPTARQRRDAGQRRQVARYRYIYLPLASPHHRTLIPSAHAVADYSAQAAINTILGRAFPDDPIIGEENADELRKDPEAAPLRSRIVELANEALTAELSLGEVAEWGIGPGQAKTSEELLDAIDRGNYGGGCPGRE
jgi:hypothetical protein